MIKCAVIKSENVYGEKIIQFYDDYDFKKWPKTLQDPSLTHGYFLSREEMQHVFNAGIAYMAGQGMTLGEYLKLQGIDDGK